RAHDSLVLRPHRLGEPGSPRGGVALPRHRMGTLWQDLRFVLRMLAKNPGFTAIAVLTLALGIGANAAIFSVIYGVLLRPLPYPKADQIVQVGEVNAAGVRVGFAEPKFEDIRHSAQSFEGVAEERSDVCSLAGGSESTRRAGAVVFG